MHVPAYRKHKSTKQAVVTVRVADGSRKDLYLGRHGTAASKKEYNRVLALLSHVFNLARKWSEREPHHRARHRT